MEEIRSVIQYVGDHRWIAIGFTMLLLGICYLLIRKPTLQREADARLQQLRAERGDYYRNLRPPR